MIFSLRQQKNQQNIIKWMTIVFCYLIIIIQFLLLSIHNSVQTMNSFVRKIGFSSINSLLSAREDLSIFYLSTLFAVLIVASVNLNLIKYEKIR